MGTNVYANGMEVSGKATPHKVLASMPDVCLSPPSPPAGPVPIPYPNFTQASDTTDGSKTVKIGGKEVNLKGKSKYKKSQGDEAATRSFGAGLISHSISGAVKHKAGSFDVKVEGSSVVRNLDLTTGNHSNPGDGCMAPDAAGVAPPATVEECKALHGKNNSERERLKEAKQKRDPEKAHETVHEAAGGNTTISHARFTGGGEILKAASKAVIHKYDNAFSAGLTPEEIEARTSNRKVKSKACGGHEYNKVPRPHTSHTESRIIEDIFSRTPPPTSGTLILAINWPGGPKAGKRTSDPCDHCKQLICAAMACLNIVICSDKNKPEKPKCPKN
jgi:hypothetical protein